jgi:hypothetical protein
VRKWITGVNKQRLLSKAKHLKKLKFPYAVQVVSIFED